MARPRRPIAELSLERASRQVVHVELGIEISFDPNTEEFYAVLAPPSGRGSSSELHSPSFRTLVERIRERALVEPVRALSIEHEIGWGSHEGKVRIEEVEVVEYHPSRQEPFVTTSRRAGWGDRPRTYAALYLPTGPEVAELHELQRAWNAEQERYERERQRLKKRANLVMAGIKRLGPGDIKAVQASGEQVLVSFDLEPDEPEESPPDGNGSFAEGLSQVERGS